MTRTQQVVMDELEYNQPVEPIGKRVGRFVTLLGIVFAISGGVVVTQRLSEDALALLLGLSCGIVAMLPTVLLGGLWLKRELDHRREAHPRLEQTTVQPPVIVVTPQGFPGYGQASQTALLPPVRPQWQSAPMQREFKIVGGVD